VRSHVGGRDDCKIRAAIIGSGNIGTDLMLKLEGNDVIELMMVVGIDPGSEGLAMARARGLDTTPGGSSS
jgi:acetaldehyde dehydrogenase